MIYLDWARKKVRIELGLELGLAHLLLADNDTWRAEDNALYRSTQCSVVNSPNLLIQCSHGDVFIVLNIIILRFKVRHQRPTTWRSYRDRKLLCCYFSSPYL